jgi:valyl-tRNA synthetase
MNELPKTYDPGAVEPTWAQLWAEQPFRADASSSKPPFTVVIPPPNVTGSLHLGHALDNTIIDTLIRFKRMQGFEALYLPGTDHAGISTQVLVEKELKAEGTNRHALGREKFLERMWQFKEKNGGTILQQLRRLGASCDWSRERFTLDAGLSRAVRKEFVDYYHKGLAYRGKRIVNWDPSAQTVISDLEVVREERKSQLYVLRYQGPGGSIDIATQRPETIFADVAIAIHPEDERYQGLLGTQVRIPLTDRYIPVIADAAVDKDFGTGALKITPAHDPADFDIGARHGLEMPSIIDSAAKLSGPLVPQKYQGLDRFEARKALVLDLGEYLVATQDYKVQMPLSERTKAPIEPLLMEQWFIRMKPLADQVIAGLDQGQIQFVPQRWEKVNRDWLNNIRDWAVGRQLWWGHQIPAWYDSEGNIYVPDPQNPDLDCDQDPRYAHLNLTRDEDVFDTWFSSALWPFSTLGWPGETSDLSKFYPTDVLVTGYDIIFFWVARMQMSGYEFTGQRPFHTVMLHGLYLDAKGQKMSKSKNNGIDPLELMDKYGTDGCRFAWNYLSTGGQDIRHDERRYEQGRNFSNKLWNASRFVMMNLENPENVNTHKEPSLADHWILARLHQTIKEATSQLEAFDLGAATRTLYSFVWDDYCDWYLEASKPLAKNSLYTRSTLQGVLEQILKMLHPIMPFITSEIYQALNPGSNQLALQSWPLADWDPDQKAEEAFETLKQAISATRSLRQELSLSPAQPVDIQLSGEGAELVMENLELFRFLAKADPALGSPPKALVQATPSVTVYLKPEGDISAFITRQHKKVADVEKNSALTEQKLANPGFSQNADPALVTAEQERLAELQQQVLTIRESLKRLE